MSTFVCVFFLFFLRGESMRMEESSSTSPPTLHHDRSSRNELMYSFVMLRRWCTETYRQNRYRVLFAVYTLVVTWISATTMYIIQRQTERPATILESWFIAISAFSCTGLAIVDITQWHWTAQAAVLVTVECGSLALCSALPSLLRIRALRGIDSDALSPSDAMVVRRHRHVNVAIVWSCCVYWVTFQAAAIAFLVTSCRMSLWWSVFHVVSGFNNAGFSLSASSFALPSLVNKPLVLMLFVFLMPTGNTLFPVWQRVLVRLWSRVARQRSARGIGELSRRRWILLGLTWRELSEALEELLAYPSLYYTHLFSSRRTVALLAMWCALTLTDFLMFMPDFLTDAFVSEDHQWLQALFQTVTVRTTGFSIMDLSKVQLGHLMYWVMAMYLSAYPFMITERSVRQRSKSMFEEEESREEALDTGGDPQGSPVQETASLGVFSGGAVGADARQRLEEITQSAQSTVAHEIGWLYAACVLIAYTEKFDLSSGNDDATVMRTLFEVASSYGTVGLSLSSREYPALAYCAVWQPLAQFVIIVLMYFGKFRGLPQTVSIGWVNRFVQQAHRHHGNDVVLCEDVTAKHDEELPTADPHATEA